MKRMIWITVIALFGLLTTMLVGCDKATEPAEPTGSDEPTGQTINQSYDAPKTIESTEITTFRCAFYAPDGYVYELKAERGEDGVVQGSYLSRGHDDTAETLTFEADASLLTGLQGIVSKRNLAQHNGHSVHTAGLPDLFGAELSVRYASGESIDAKDSQWCFLSEAAMADLTALFQARPEPLDLMVREETVMENTTGVLAEIRYPVLTLGYPNWRGEAEAPEGYTSLQTALEDYSLSVRKGQESLLHYNLRPAAERLAGTDATEVYARSGVFVTRSDSAVVAFYERQRVYTGPVDEMDFVTTFNFDAQTGEVLDFQDVFSDVYALPDILAEAFAAAAPELRPTEESKEVIREAIRTGNGRIGFALGYGGVHFFAEKNPLGGDVGLVQTMLSYEEYPALVSFRYRAEPERWLLKLDYDRDYTLPDGLKLRMGWRMTDDWDGKWELTLNGKTESRHYYGHAPICYIVSTGGASHLYLEEPRGDLSYHTTVYHLTADGLLEQATVEAAISDTLNMHPEHLIMVSNDDLYSGSFLLQPWGMFSVDEMGAPTLAVRDEYGINGPVLYLVETVQAVLADPKDASMEADAVTLAAGTRLTPFRTDKRSYLDFLDDTGRVCRFTIDAFADDMILGGYGTLDELFTQSAYAGETQPTLADRLCGVYREVLDGETEYDEQRIEISCIGGTVLVDHELLMDGSVYSFWLQELRPTDASALSGVDTDAVSGANLCFSVMSGEGYWADMGELTIALSENGVLLTEAASGTAVYERMPDMAPFHALPPEQLEVLAQTNAKPTASELLGDWHDAEAHRSALLTLKADGSFSYAVKMQNAPIEVYTGAWGINTQDELVMTAQRPDQGTMPYLWTLDWRLEGGVLELTNIGGDPVFSAETPDSFTSAPPDWIFPAELYAD